MLYYNHKGKTKQTDRRKPERKNLMFTIDQIKELYDYALAKFEDALIANRTAVEIANETGINSFLATYSDRLAKCKNHVDAAHTVMEYMVSVKAAHTAGPFRVPSPVDPTTDPDTKAALEELASEYYSS